MGLDANACRLLLLAKREGADFSRTLCLGRLNLVLSRGMLRRSLREFGLFGGEAQLDRMLGDPAGFAEPFLRELGAVVVDSVDAADHEGATHVHDLNTGLPEAMRGRYDLVLDGGTLEHVFNVPAALKGAMEAVREGGRLVMVTQGNNAMGHGFYQFSPELLHRALAPENGFRMERMFVAEGSFGRVPWHEVADPRAIGGRVELVNDVPAFLLVIARRISPRPAFAAWPQQSDYAEAWRERRADTNFRPVLSARFEVREHLPAFVKRLGRILRLLLRPRFRPPGYRPVDPAALVRPPPRGES